MDRFDALQAFARVVEAASFTKAAQTLHMSKTTVTQLVQQLETPLRVKLLNRTTRQVQVTADGATRAGRNDARKEHREDTLNEDARHAKATIVAGPSP